MMVLLPIITQAVGRLRRVMDSGSPSDSKVGILFRLIAVRKPYRAAILIFGIGMFLGVKLARICFDVRVGALPSTRIGSLAGFTEVYFRKLRRGHRETGRRDVFLTPRPANHQLLRMIGRKTYLLCNNILFESFTKIKQMFPGSDCWAETGWNRGTHWQELTEAASVLSFVPFEEEKGATLLKRMGVEPDKEFVCFNARDPRYLDEAYTFRARSEWAYHDYRDCRIANYIPSAEHLTQCGLFAVRMGYLVRDKLRTENHKIIDYSTRYRSDFGDVYLSAKCKFFLGSEGGLINVPWCFGVPVAYTNSAPPLGAVAWRDNDLFIPKLLWHIQDRRFLSFGEILEIGADWWLQSEHYRQAGLEIVENTSEEILAITKEMNDRIDKKWVETEEDIDLQRRFKAHYKPENRGYGFESKIGAEFLRQHSDLLS